MRLARTHASPPGLARGSRRAPHLPRERDAAEADQQPVDDPNGPRQHGQPAREPDGEDDSRPGGQASAPADGHGEGDRKSTRLNSSHLGISYAVFCLKKKKTIKNTKLRRTKK